MIDHRIALAGQQPNIMNALAQGTQAAGQTAALQRQAGLQNLYRQQGAGIMRGEENALRALAEFDPNAALGVQQTRQAMSINEAQLAQIRQQTAQNAQAHAMKMSAAEAAAEAQKIQAGMTQVLPMVMQARETGDVGPLNQALQAMGMSPVQDVNEALIRVAQHEGVFEVLSNVTEMQKPPEPLSPEGKLEADRRAGLVSEAPTKPDAEDIAKLRKEFNSLPAVKDFSSQADAYGRIVSSASDPSAAGDLSLIFNYMKLLDPGSTVREGEFATAQNAAGIPQRVVSAYNNALRGERLSPEQRADFVGTAERLYRGAEQQFARLEAQYKEIAQGQGFGDGSLIDFRYQSDPRRQAGGSISSEVLQSATPPDSVSESDAELWQYMTPLERKAILEGQ